MCANITYNNYLTDTFLKLFFFPIIGELVIDFRQKVWNSYLILKVDIKY